MKITLLTAAALLALTPAAFAASETFSADLKSASEVPANDSKGSGTLTVTYDTASKKLTYTATYKDLSRTEAMSAAQGIANDRAVAAGAARASLATIESEDMPLAYLPGNSVRVRVRVVGDVAAS